MITLAIDTTLLHCAAAVCRDGQVLACHVVPEARGQVERLPLLVQSLLAEAALSPADLGRVVVATGPGSFMGIRVGVSFARGMALALAVPCIGISTLEGLASGHRGRVLALVDAGRDSFLVQRFCDGVPMAEPVAVAPDALPQDVDVIVGNLPDTLVHPAQLVRCDGVDPVVLAQLAKGRDAATSPARATYHRDAGARAPV